jgi:hypothetical protein
MLFNKELGACRNTLNIEAVGKCADVKRERSKAQGTGQKEKQMTMLVEQMILSLSLSPCALRLLYLRRSDEG